LHPGLTRFLQQNTGAHDIRAGKGPGIENRPIDVRFRRAIDDPLDAVFPQRSVHRFLIADIGVHKGVLRMAGQIGEIFKIAGILQRIQVHDRMMAALNQATHQMRSDKAGPARHENTHLELHPVRPGLRDELIGSQQRFDRAGIRPPAVQHIPGQFP